MGYTISELEKLQKKSRFEGGEQKAQATTQLYHYVNSQLEYALRLLTATHWWLGWKGALMGAPILTTDPDISTACVGFNSKTSRMDYYFNLWFAASLSAGDIAFIIAHECLHLILKHVEQIKTFGIDHPTIWNIVADAYINETLKRTLKWSEGMRKEERQSWTISNGVYWKDLPPAVREKFPNKLTDQGAVDIEQTCIELYQAFLEDLEKNGIDPGHFEKQVEQKHFGNKKKRQKKMESGEESTEKITHQPVYVTPGDIVFVKSKDTYGVIEKLKRVKDQEGEVDIFYADDIAQPEWVWLSRAVGITDKLGKKSFEMSRKIVEVYAKMKANNMRPMTWEPFAKAVGIPEIAYLDEIDKLIQAHELAEMEAIQREEEELEKQAAEKAQHASSSKGKGKFSM